MAINPETGRGRVRRPAPVRDGSGFLGHSLTIGTIAGTKVRLHWTFVVYLAWVGIATLFAGGASAAVGAVGLIAAVFACVVAHEFGHILMARRFGIPTPDVTLLPIGGVARLRRLPERAGQEFAVAIAGPLVNLALAAALVFVLGIAPADLSKAPVPTVRDILPSLATINLFLALFNLIPAFPMDGGRILRAVLAAFLDRARATRIAAAVGQLLAIGFGLLGLVSGNAILIFIAIFVYLAAGAEAHAVQLHRAAEPLRVADAMLTEMRTLSTADTLGDAAQLLLRTGQQHFPVFDSAGQLAGVLGRDQLIRGLHVHGKTQRVADAMSETCQIVPADSSLDDALALMEENDQPIVVCDGERIAGLVTRESLGDLLLLAESRAS
ncbi:MAG TPA: site-2 protease family protein [Croceibacterium sp.]|nr:site-2 protease family protein [Croceibacterium sp.]